MTLQGLVTIKWDNYIKCLTQCLEHSSLSAICTYLLILLLEVIISSSISGSNKSDTHGRI